MDLSRWWWGSRTPELESMEEEGEAEAYASAAAARHLDRMDDRWVARLLASEVPRGRALDVGTGPGQIPIKLVLREPRLMVVGVDLSRAMLTRAHRDARRLDLIRRPTFASAQALALPFRDASFDLVFANSLLHHLARPAEALDEMARVVRPGGLVVLRDLLRPPRPLLPLHIALVGRHYRGLMRDLFAASVRSAYTRAEARVLLEASRLAGAPVSTERCTYLVVLRRFPATG